MDVADSNEEVVDGVSEVVEGVVEAFRLLEVVRREAPDFAGEGGVGASCNSLLKLYSLFFVVCYVKCAIDSP